MDLDARVDGSFVRVDVNFQTVTVIYFCYVYIYFFFHFDISQHQGPTYTPYKNSAKYTAILDLNARDDVIFLGST